LKKKTRGKEELFKQNYAPPHRKTTSFCGERRRKKLGKNNKLFPPVFRLCALCESSGEENRWENFLRRLSHFLPHLVAVNFPLPQVHRVKLSLISFLKKGNVKTST
jgi:hypothetical protein